MPLFLSSPGFVYLCIIRISTLHTLYLTYLKILSTRPLLFSFIKVQPKAVHAICHRLNVSTNRYKAKPLPITRLKMDIKKDLPTALFLEGQTFDCLVLIILVDTYVPQRHGYV